MNRSLLLAALLLVPAGGSTPARAATPRDVPYRLTETQHILVRARVNGKGPFHFIVDTGAPAVYLSPAAARKAGVTAGKDGWSVLDRLELEGGTLLEKMEARVEEPPQLTGMNAMGLAGSRLDGIFGYSLLSRFRVEIDLSRAVMQWTPVPYVPLPLLGLQELAGDTKPTPNPNAGAMQLIGRLASVLFARPMVAPVARGYLGFDVVEGTSGLEVGEVLGGSPASAAGLLRGDRILQAERPGGSATALKKRADLVQLASALAADEELVLEIERAGKPLRVSLRGARGAF